MTENPPLAVVGIGCRFPGGADTPDELWNLLVEGRDGFTEVPADRWDHERFYDPDPERPGKMYVEEGAFLDHPIFEMDTVPFGLTPHEVDHMDPQQRLMLETTWEAFEDAGMPLREVRNSNTGVFIGGFTLDNLTVQNDFDNHHLIDQNSATGVTLAMLSNRLSHLFDLRGPSVSMDTACSSSLTATHLACQSIWSGSCDQAVVGGVNVMLRPGFPIAMCKGGFLSSHARCMMFDERADGYARGEGAGAVVVKPLEQAREDGDRIYASIVATGSNQDGRTSGISRPCGQAQVDLVESIIEEAGVDPAHVRYVEAHGTGTQAGDSAEADSLHRALGGDRRSQPLLVGSIKTNIGHLEAAAGVAGLVKAALCIHHNAVPKNLYFEQPNPDIPFDELRLEVPEETRRLEGDPLYVGINSFGYGGTNAHVLLKEPPELRRASGDEPEKPKREEQATFVVPVSACSPDALIRRAADWADLIEARTDTELVDFVYTAQQRSSHHRHRLAVLARQRSQLVQKLRGAATEKHPEGVIRGEATSRAAEPVFVYTGMGPQWWAMGRQLMDEPVFADTLEQVDALFEKIAGWSILEEMTADEEASRIGETRVAQPANFALQVALTRLWEWWGVEPAAVVGHSVGEVAAGWASGALSLRDAVTVSYHRSRLQQSVALEDAESRPMLAAGVDEQQARELVADHPGVGIAAVNAASDVTFSGDPDAIARLAASLEGREVFHRLLDVEVAYHSPDMDAVRAELEEALAGIEPRSTDVELISTVTGDAVDGTELDGSYWGDNIRRPVRFRDAAMHLVDDGFRTFLQVGPHPVLRNAIGETFRQMDVEGRSLPSIRRKQPEVDRMLQSLGALHTCGVEVCWERIGSNHGDFVAPPRYPWQRERYWVESKKSELKYRGEDVHPLLQTPQLAPTPSWRAELIEQKLPWLRDHAIGETTVFPGAAYLEAAIAMARTIDTDGPAIVEDVDFEQLLTIDDGSILDIQVNFDGRRRWSIASRRRGDDNWTTHARGAICFGDTDEPDVESLARRRARLDDESVDVDALYDQLAARDLDYGPAFRTVDELLVGEGEALVELHFDGKPDGYIVHPAMLDGIFQATVAAVDDRTSRDPFVPVGVDRLEWHGAADAALTAHIAVRQANGAEVVADITAWAGDDVVGRLEGVTFRPMALDESDDQEAVDYEFVWRERPEPTEETTRKSSKILVVAGEKTASRLESDGEFEPVVARWRDDTDQPERLAEICASRDIEHVVFVPPAGGDDPVSILEATSWKIASTVRAVAGLDEPPMVALVFDETRRLVGRSLAPGFRVIRSEFPDLCGDIVEVADGDDGLRWDRILREISASDAREIRLEPDRRLVRRLTPIHRHGEDDGETTRTVDTDRPVELEIERNGELSSLHYRPLQHGPPGDRQLRVRVEFTALNFKDLLKFSGQLDPRVTRDTFFGSSRGMECVGVVDEVGDDVSKFQPGDRVGLFGRDGCFKSVVTTDEQTAAHLPDHVAFDDAVSTFIPFITSWHALTEIARLEPGETLLIHSAAGGVGFMAVQVAQLVGATVMATAGTEEKRRMLRDEAGVEFVSDSRSLAYLDDVRRWTDGRGVDVVLSAKSGSQMAESLRLLDRYGRYVDIGKRAHIDNEELSLRIFNEALTYSAIDMDRLLEDRTEYCMDIARHGIELAADGDIEFPPTTVYEAGEVEDAFRHMATGDHYGRLMVDYSCGPVDVVDDRHSLATDGVHVVTGGLGGFGRQVALHLARRGASALLLLSRRGMETPGAEALVEELTELGAEVGVESVDVTDRPSLADVLENVRRDWPIRGIFHCAMVLRDELISDLGADNLHRVVEPKARGAWNLHKLTADDPVEHFVNFSSVSTIVGTPGQFSYAAANGFLDALARQRHDDNQPGISVQWGVLGEVGVAARNEEIAEGLRDSGLAAMSNQTALRGLRCALNSDRAALGIFEIDWEQWSARFPDVSTTSIYSEVHTTDVTDAPVVNLVRSLLSTNPSKWAEEVARHLREHVADVLRIDPGQIPLDQPVSEIGLDSLLAADLVAQLGAEGYSIRRVQLMGGPTIRQLAAECVESLREACIEHLDALAAAELDERQQHHLAQLVEQQGEERQEGEPSESDERWWATRIDRG